MLTQKALHLIAKGSASQSLGGLVDPVPGKEKGVPARCCAFCVPFILPLCFAVSVAFCSPAKSLTLSGLLENPLVAKSSSPTIQANCTKVGVVIHWAMALGVLDLLGLICAKHPRM